VVPVPVDKRLYAAPDEETAREVEEGIKRFGGLMGPFVKGLYAAAVKGGENAARTLAEEGGRLSPEEVRYLMRVVEDGLRAKRKLEEYLEWEERMREKGVRFYWELGGEKRRSRGRRRKPRSTVSR
jgi:hypothetical protein